MSILVGCRTQTYSLCILDLLELWDLGGDVFGGGGVVC